MIYLTGDTHGDISRFDTAMFPEGVSLTKFDVVIQLGDFGVLWSPVKSDNELYWMEWLANKQWTTLVIPGNHENHDEIESLPVGIKWGAKVRVYEINEQRVYFGIPGEIYTIENETFLCIPKALSIDKELRTEGESWWSKELLSKQEENNVLDSLDKVDWNVDYVITHTCPTSIIGQAIDDYTINPKYNDPTSKFLEFIANRLKFNHWFFGHFHNDRTFKDASEDSYSCLYHTLSDINNIKKSAMIKE